MMSYLIDPRTREFLWRCPQCGESIRFSDLLALQLAEDAGRCQGCRARATLQRRPELASVFLDLWEWADAWPQSSSWVQAIPVSA